MTTHAYRRARRAFWALVALAVLLTSALSRALNAPPSARTGLTVAVVATLTVVVLALAARLLLALTGDLPRRRHDGAVDR